MDDGNFSSHTDYFMKCRNENLQKTTDPTNHLIIRLDKLINDYRELDEGSRKTFEKRIVPWSENSEFQNCAICYTKFSITKRKHHCRLCGKIMCQGCSQFLSFESAKKLTGSEFPTYLFYNNNEIAFGEQKKNGEKEIPSLITKRRVSFTSSAAVWKTKTEKLGSLLIDSITGGAINSLIPGGTNSDIQIDPAGNGGSLRICGACKSLLDRREESMGLKAAQSVFVDIYQKLFELLGQISNLIPSYRRMVHTLNNGEALYTLDSANELRKKIVSIQREITSLSERIESWGMSEDPLFTREPTVRELVLQKNIKIFAMNALQTEVIGIPDLPSEEEYKKLRVAYQERKRYAEERRMAERSMVERSPIPLMPKPFSSNPMLGSFIRDRLPFGAVSSNPFYPNKVVQQHTNQPSSSSAILKQSSSFTGSYEEGWAPTAPDSPRSSNSLNPFEEPSRDLEDSHPLQTQYLNIRSFLKQAAQAGRRSDIEILERNLIEMEEELKRCNLEIPTTTRI